MMGGWLWDDVKMPMDEKKTWGNLWNLFWRGPSQFGQKKMKT